MEKRTTHPGHWGLQQAIMLCTACVGSADDQPLLAEQISEIHADVQENGPLAFAELIAAFLAMVDALMDAVGCDDTASKMLLLQTLALTSEGRI